MCGLWLPNFSDSRHDLPGHTDSLAGLVPRDVVGDDPEERRPRLGVAASVGTEELRDCLNPTEKRDPGPGLPEAVTHRTDGFRPAPEKLLATAPSCFMRFARA